MEPTSDLTSWNLPQPTAQPPLNDHGTGQGSDTSQPTYASAAGTSGQPGVNSLPVAPSLAKVVPAGSQAADTLSDKEWAERVKSVVEQTREDPWQQSNEVMRLRKEYLQKHHGKVFKVNE